MSRKRILFFASVNNVSLFSTQQFYRIDIDLLKELGAQVKVTNCIKDYLMFWSYDIAFIYFYRWGLFVAVIAKFWGKKVFFTGGIDDLDFDYSSKRGYLLQKLLFKFCYLLANRCFIVSNSDANNIRRIYNGRLPSRITISHHAIKIEEFFRQAHLDKENIFTSIAWMESIPNVQRKGIDKALIIFKYLTEKPEFKDSKFYIIGKEGVGSDFLKSICHDIHLTDRVLFTGSISEVSKIELLLRSRFYFQLSKYEGFGLAALEALATLNIVIHSGKGGLNDSISFFGLDFDISNGFENRLPALYERIKNFNSSLFVEAEKHINNNFSSARRKKDFEIILL